MTIYSRFGDPCKLVRFATMKDVKEYEKRKADKEDKRRTSEGWRFICEWTDEAEAALRDEAARLPRPSPLPDWLVDRERASGAV